MPSARGLEQTRAAAIMGARTSHSLRDVIALFHENEPPPARRSPSAEVDALRAAYRRTVQAAMRWSDGHGLLCSLVRLHFGERWNTPLFLESPSRPDLLVAAGLEPDVHKTALLLAAVTTRMILDGEIPAPHAVS